MEEANTVANISWTNQVEKVRKQHNNKHSSNLTLSSNRARNVEEISNPINIMQGEKIDICTYSERNRDYEFKILK